MLFKYLQVEGGWGEGGRGVFLNGFRVRPEVQGPALRGLTWRGGAGPQPEEVEVARPNRAEGPLSTCPFAE